MLHAMRRQAWLGLVVIWQLALSGAHAATPQGPWQTMHTPHFRFHFLPDDALAAQTLAAMAPAVRTYVIQTLAEGSPVAQLDPGTVEILLVSWTDIANGLSTQIPYNQIQIHLFPPRSFESLQAYRSWLETVFVHEYTHAVHIAMARGPTRWLRYVFGRSIVNGVQVSQSNTAYNLSLWPVLPFFTGFPNQFLPGWNIEGLAVNVESWATGRGRLYAAQSREIMRNAAAAGTLPRWDDLSNFGRSDWPYGTADYLYGAGFLGSLTRTQAVGFQRTNALGLLPMLPWASFRAGSGLRLGDSWRRYHLSLRTEATRQRLEHDRDVPAKTLASYGDRSSLTSDGESFFWIERDGSRVTSIVQAAPAGDSQATEWKLTRHAARGAEWIGVNQDWIAAQVIDWPSRAQLRNRVVLWRRADHKLFEPVNGWRMLEPTLNTHHDIAAVRHTPQASELWLGRVISDGSLRWSAEPLARSATESYHTPAVSPAGTRVAYVAHRGASAHDIVLWERSTGHSRVLYSSEREDLLPVWTGEDHLQFVSDRAGDFQLYSFSLTDSTLRQHSHSAHGWYQTAVMGPYTAALRLTAEGYRVTVQDSTSLPARPAPSPAAPYREGEMAVSAAIPPDPITDATITDYRPWRMLLPRAWTPIMYLRAPLLDGPGRVVTGLGASLSGSDLLGRHSWSLSAASRLDTWQPEGNAAYAYGGERADAVASFASYVPTLQVPTSGHVYEARHQNAALYTSWQQPRRTRSLGLSAGVQVLDFALPLSTRIAPGDGKFFGRAGGPFLNLSWSSYTRTPRINGPHDGLHMALRPQLWVAQDAAGQQSALGFALAEAGAAKHLFARNRLAVKVWAGASSDSVLRYRAFGISGENWTLAGDPTGYNPLTGISLLGLQVNQARYRTYAYSFVGSEVGAFQLLLDQPLWMPERGWANLIWFQGLRLIGYFEGAVLDFTTLGRTDDWTMPPTVGAEIESSWAFVDSIGMRIGLGYLTRPVYDAHEFSVRIRLGL